MDWLVSAVRAFLEGVGPGDVGCFVLTAIVLRHVYKVEDALSDKAEGGPDGHADDGDGDVVGEPR